MQPKAYLALLHKEWKLMVELFESSKNGPIDYGTLLILIDAYKRPTIETNKLFERLLDHGILGQPLSSETLYQLGGLAETIISQLLKEQRLGLSDSIQANIAQLDKLSRKLLQATNDHDPEIMAIGAKKLWQHTQDIKHQIYNNLQAIRNIVGEAKKQESSKPLRQRYADVIDAWEQYITPMGEMIEVRGAFDSIIDSATGRMSQAIRGLESSGGALISEVSNLRHVHQMLNDMRRYILQNFQIARDILKPLYEVARLNSKVTRGASIVIDDLQKGKVKDVWQKAMFPIHRRSQFSLVSTNSALLSYYYGVKEVEDKPSPVITSPTLAQRRSTVKKPPLNSNVVLRKLNRDLPVEDVMDWSIQQFPEYPTDNILDIIVLVYSQPNLSVERGVRQKYKTITHLIEGPSLAVENIND